MAPVSATSCSLLEVGLISAEVTTSTSNTQGSHLNSGYPNTTSLITHFLVSPIADCL